MLDSLYNDLPLPQSSGTLSCSSSSSVSTSVVTNAGVSAGSKSVLSHGSNLVGNLYSDLYSDESTDDVGIAAAAWSAHRSKILAPLSVRKREASAISSVSSTSLSSSSLSSSLSSSSNNVSSVMVSGRTEKASKKTIITSSSSSSSLSSNTSSYIIPPVFVSSSSQILSSTSSSVKTGSSMSSTTSSSFYTTTVTTANTPFYKAAINEYEPLKPNEYDKIVKERMQKIHMEEMEKKRQQELAEAEKKRKQEQEEKHKHKKKLADDDNSVFSPNKSLQSSNNDKNSLQISGEEAWQRRAQLSANPPSFSLNKNERQRSSSPVSSSPSYTASTKKTTLTSASNNISPSGERKSVAARMMEKMGWRHGEGLGREKQGMTGILIAKKTDKRSGVIVQGGLAKASGGSNSPHSSSSSSVNSSQKGFGGSSSQGVSRPSPGQADVSDITNSKPTRIVLLTNLVGAGDVDQDLEGEIQEEASKFGNLLNVQIFEAKNVPDEESVRIFCAYESPVQAHKALTAMNGRVFGGRIVKARFYDLNRFNKGDLAPP